MTYRLTLIAAIALLSLLPATTAAAREIQRPDLLKEFESAGTSGTMVVRQSGAHGTRTVVVGDRRSRARFLPSSTFKVPNALIAIDEGVASGPEQRYPGPNPNFLVDGAPFLPAACEGDLTLRTAFASSCIPIFQRIARAVGERAYRHAVRAFGYGNGRFDGAAVDAFWLEGRFGISAREQVRFLERLRHGALPVARTAVAGVRDMMVLERTGDTVLRGKTGWVFSTSPERGWWVGSVERPGHVSTFALNLDITQPSHAAARTRIGRRILERLDAFG